MNKPLKPPKKGTDIGGIVKTTVPATAGVIGLASIFHKALDVIEEADAERIEAMTLLMSQFGSIPFVAIVAMAIVAYMCYLALVARTQHINDLRSRIEELTS